jgi:thiamine-monophosphate kinase
MTSNPNSPARGELELVRRLRDLLSPGSAHGTTLIGFGDDMSLLDATPPPLLWTVDMLMDGVDFDSTRHPWRAIGRKAMAVNLSDCAAMATVPVAALCAVALQNSLSMDDALDLVHGAHEYGLTFQCPIVGGDTNSWDAPTVVSICIAARCEPGGRPVGRDGAHPGDRIWLTGRVGGSLLGRHMTFEPRVATALQINRRLAPHAMIDISDGLALDLARILEASGCGAVLEEKALDAVIHPDADRLSTQDQRTPRDHALQDGEDFELIVVLPADAPADECERLQLLPLGTMVGEDGLWLATSGGQREPIAIRGWEHFRQKKRCQEPFVRSTRGAAARQKVPDTFSFVTKSPQETFALGQALGHVLRGGDFIALSGPLGAGKTHLVKGIAAGLGVLDDEPVVSPTFVLIREYRGRLKLYHIDAYRLHGPAELLSLGLDEIIAEPDAVTALEWADRVADAIPAGACWIDLEHLGRRVRRVCVRWDELQRWAEFEKHARP